MSLEWKSNSSPWDHLPNVTTGLNFLSAARHPCERLSCVGSKFRTIYCEGQQTDRKANLKPNQQSFPQKWGLLVEFSEPLKSRVFLFWNNGSRSSLHKTHFLFFCRSSRVKRSMQSFAVCLKLYNNTLRYSFFNSVFACCLVISIKLCIILALFTTYVERKLSTWIGTWCISICISKTKGCYNLL